MRMTRLVAKTLREAPADAEAISHRLLVRAGYIRRISSGVYSYLPLGFRVLRKIESIVREEFDAAGAQELLLPALQPIELWEETGRTKTMDDVLMRLEVRGADFVLGPTHEEAVIATVAQDIASYRDLPATVYQIQTKFRAEARPRFGLLRTREFIMADAYSFDADQEGMRASYRAIFDAYCRAFDRLGVTYYPVEADAGSIG
ncbi:MAG: proline--tRNA ligase, partial [Actinomycetota bacterium]|nr:proline--tRNA ligase [Actinomycetota bacterium]